MRNRTLARLAVCGGLLFAGSSVNAQAKGGGGAAPVPAAGGGAAAAGGGAAAAPVRGGSAAPVNRGNGGNATPAPRENRPAPGAAPQRTVGPSGQASGQRTAQGEQDRSRVADPNGLSKDGRRGRFGRGDRAVFVPSWYGWSPYSWWWNGYSYWSPPLDGSYRDDSTNGGGQGSSAAADVAPGDRAVPNAPSPGLDQAQAINGLEGSPAYAGMMAEFKKAQADYDAASRRATEKLKSDRTYQDLVGQREQLGDRVEAVQAAAKIPSPERVTETAQRKLDVSSRVTRMEQDAINADPEARAAKEKIVELNEKLTAMRKGAGVAGGR